MVSQPTMIEQMRRAIRELDEIAPRPAYDHLRCAPGEIERQCKEAGIELIVDHGAQVPSFAGIPVIETPNVPRGFIQLCKRAPYTGKPIVVGVVKAKDIA